MYRLRFLVFEIISRLKTIWQDDLKQWQQRDLSNKRYVYIWADGIYCNVRMEERQCLLVIIGATKEGKKELLALESGFRESELSWAEHWRHIRTTNPIESTFSSVRLRTAKVRSCFSSTTVVTMAFKLCQSAQKRWQRLHRSERLAAVIEGVKFVNGIEEKRNAA
ncbi:MAG: transposase [Deltaproteobacteria bacterium]|nr:transposase [Deltaproteobacteria bacterium]